jgi:hypothetical protein
MKVKIYQEPPIEEYLEEVHQKCIAAECTDQYFRIYDYQELLAVRVLMKRKVITVTEVETVYHSLSPLAAQKFAPTNDKDLNVFTSVIDKLLDELIF